MPREERGRGWKMLVLKKETKKEKRKKWEGEKLGNDL